MIFFAIPYRGMPTSYAKFVDRFPSWCSKAGVDARIIVVEQEAGKRFNLAKLSNCGYKLLDGLYSFKPDDAFYFHPIDCLPVNANYNLDEFDSVMHCDPNYSEHYPKTMGFSVSALLKINGFPVNYWGWGGEDSAMKCRVQHYNLTLDIRKESFDVSGELSPSYVNREYSEQQDGKQGLDMETGFRETEYELLSIETISENVHHAKVSI
jgi:hypothetical protein